MRYVFFGTPEFAAIILEKLIKSGFVPAAVVCNPDRPVGRKKILTPPPAKIIAQKYDIPVWQPETLIKSQNPALREVLDDSSLVSDNGPKLGTLKKSIFQRNFLSSGVVDNSNSEPAEGFVPKISKQSEDRFSRIPLPDTADSENIEKSTGGLRDLEIDTSLRSGNFGTPSEPKIPSLGPHYTAGSQDLLYQNWDLFVVAAYAKILPKEILEIPRLGSIGVHPSLLPKYRGPSPIQSAILNGEKETGVTLFLMDEKVDHGPILAQKALENYKLGIMNYESLMQKLAELGANLLIALLQSNEALRLIEAAKPQDDSLATYTKKFTTEDGYVDLEKDDPVIIERKVRALNLEPGVWTYSYESTKLYAVAKQLPRGTITKKHKKRMKILEAELTPNGKLKLKKIQIEGGKPQNI